MKSKLVKNAGRAKAAVMKMGRIRTRDVDFFISWEDGTILDSIVQFHISYKQRRQTHFSPDRQLCRGTPGPLV